VDERDPGTSPRVVFYLEHAIQDAGLTRAGERRIVSKRMLFMWRSEERAVRSEKREVRSERGSDALSRDCGLAGGSGGLSTGCVPANIAEGWTREGIREKTQFLAIAHASLAETETLLTLCEDLGWFPKQETAVLRGLLDEVSRMLTVMRRKQRQT
jgi:hypothetical protein